MPRPDLPRLLLEATTSGSAKALLARLHALRDQRDADAMAVLALLYDDGLLAVDGRMLVIPDPKLAKRYYTAAAALGNPPAMARLADDLDRSASPAHRARAITLYKGAARRGYATAAYNLAVSYHERASYRQAVTWFRRAAALGNDTAALRLAVAEFYGRGLRANPPAALQKLVDLARRSSWISELARGDALVFAANALREGWVVKRNFTEAIRLLREAADIGSEAARGLLRDLGHE